VLYAKVNGIWEPVLGGVGDEWVNITGDHMTGPQGLWIDQVGAWPPAADNDAPLRIGGQPGSPRGAVHMILDSNRIQARTGAVNFTLGLNTLGGAIDLGGDAVATTTVMLRGTTPSGTPLVFLANGLEIGRMFPFGNTIPNDLVIQTHSTQGRDLALQAARDISLTSGGSESARVIAAGFLVGKTVSTVATAGLQSIQDGQSLQVTTALAGASPAPIILNLIDAAIGSGSLFCHFRTNNNTIGSITRNLQQAAVLFNTTSDYRLKHDRGLVAGARDRIRVLRPRRVVWREDPTETEVDGFFAHEVAEVVPDAVTGAKDAVDDDGKLVPQQLDATRLIPLLTAALQEAHDRIDALEARLTALEAA